MIDELEVRGFRSFSELHVRGLTHVNVIVGRNNAGKTSLLEAVEALFLRQGPMSLLRSLWRRQEVQSRGGREQDDTGGELLFDVRQLFFGRKLEDGSSFSVIGRSGSTVLRLDVMAESEPTTEAVGQMPRAIQETTRLVLRVRAESDSFNLPLTGKALPISSFRRGGPFSFIRSWVFVGTTPMEARDRGRLWDLIVGNEDEDFVTEALRAVEPSVERVLFTVSDGYDGAPTPFVRLRGVPERVPLGNLGHGATRLLEIAMLLVQARDGAFLMDEIEIGLHYSVMASVWRLILATAQRLRIQVFATTHSQDCLQALAGLYQNDRSLANVVSLHRLDAGAPKSERFSMDDIEIAEDSKLELRGLP